MLVSNDGSVSPGSPPEIECTVRVSQSFGAWVTHGRTPQSKEPL